jgi:hypothetical protein
VIRELVRLNIALRGYRRGRIVALDLDEILRLEHHVESPVPLNAP